MTLPRRNSASSDDPRSVPAGSEIFREGDPGDRAYIIQSGAVEISTEQDGRHLVLARRGPGEIFGEMAIVDAKPRSATATAVVDCELIVVSDAQLRRRLAGLDPVLRMVVGVILDRFRETVNGPAGAGLPASEEEADAALEQHRIAIQQITLEQEIRRALDSDEFHLYYQPIVCGQTRRTLGFEALSRWVQPSGAVLAPDSFIPCAEETGLISDISRWVVRQACRDVKRLLKDAGPEAAPFVSINLSPNEICDPTFFGDIERALGEADLHPSHLRVEVTETCVIDNPDSATAFLQKLRANQITVCIDDFGSGYSNLSMLADYPADVLKIDKSFVDRVGDGKGGARLLRSIVEIGHIFDMEIVAEGVETTEQADVLREISCDKLQGYLFGRPMPIDAAFRGFGS